MFQWLRRAWGGQPQRRAHTNLGIESLENREVPTAGLLDPLYGVNGQSLAGNPTFGVLRSVQAMTVQTDGKIVLVGTVRTPGGNDDFGIVRLHANGYFDTSFGSNGMSFVGFNLGGANADVANAVTVDRFGRILVSGWAERGNGNHDFAITRLTNNGWLDVAFGSNGRQTVDFNLGGTSLDQARSLALDHFDRIVLAGHASTATGSLMAVTRLTATGALDTAFGRRTVNFGLSGTRQEANDVAVDASNRIIVVGWADRVNWSDRDFAIARLTSAGDLDATFGTNAGRTVKAFDLLGVQRDEAKAVALEPGTGRIYVAGTAHTETRSGDVFLNTPHLAVVRLSANGLLEMNTVGAGFEVADLALDKAGRVVLAGTSNSTTATARLHATGLYDTTYGAGGIAKVNFSGQSYSTGAALALTSDGQILTAASVAVGSQTQWGTAQQEAIHGVYSTLVDAGVRSAARRGAYADAQLTRPDMVGIFDQVVSNGVSLHESNDLQRLLGRTADFGIEEATANLTHKLVNNDRANEIVFGAGTRFQTGASDFTVMRLTNLWFRGTVRPEAHDMAGVPLNYATRAGTLYGPTGRPK